MSEKLFFNKYQGPHDEYMNIIKKSKRGMRLAAQQTNWIKKGPMGITDPKYGKISPNNSSNIREIKRAFDYGYRTMSKDVAKNVASFNKQYHLAAKGLKAGFPEERMVSAQLAKYGKVAPAIAKGSKLLGGITPGAVAMLAAEGLYKGTKRALGPGGTEFHTKKSKNKYGTKGY